MRIRRAQEQDLPQMEGLWKELMDYHQDLDPFFTRRPDGHERWLEYVKTNMASERWLLLVAEVNGEVVGYIMAAIQECPPVFTTSEFGFVQDVAVRATHRRRGIATALYALCEEWFRDMGVRRMELNALAANEVSTAFWRRMGYGDYLWRMAKAMTED
jgi:GNAT superfamily N-acetyltransferase